MTYRPRRWQLRSRLLVLVVALATVVSVVVITMSAVALRGSLIDQLDRKLQVSSNRATRPPDPTDPDTPQVSTPDIRASNDYPFLLGQGPGTLGVIIEGGQVLVASLLGDNGDNQPLDLAAVEPLATIDTDARPRTVSIDGLGDYRVMAAVNSQGQVIVTGLPLDDVISTVSRLVTVEIGIAAAGIAIVTVIASVVIRMTLRPLRRVAATAARVSELPLHEGDVALVERVAPIDTDPRTEVGQVGAALNTLLAHVDCALTTRHETETHVRQFVADASHELRTPLAAIRGYAELTRRQPAELPPDVVRAMGRVEAETQRMTFLVEDMMLLARLDAGRPLDVRPVDLSRLVVDAVSDARVTNPRHHWRLDAPETAITVPGDQERLHQVLTNLLGNAGAHTPPGTTVTTNLSHRSDQVQLRISDDGPGIPPALVPQLFQRFARGDSSRSRAAGGTGLGLAIVDAVVTAHGGTIDVSSRPGATVFTVTLFSL